MDAGPGHGGQVFQIVGQAGGDLDGGGVAAVGAGGVVHQLDQLRGGAAGGEEAVAQAAGAFGRVRGVAADDDGDGAVGRLGAHIGVLEAEEFPFEGGFVGAP